MYEHLMWTEETDVGHVSNVIEYLERVGLPS